MQPINLLAQNPTPTKITSVIEIMDELPLKDMVTKVVDKKERPSRWREDEENKEESDSSSTLEQGKPEETKNTNVDKKKVNRRYDVSKHKVTAYSFKPMELQVFNKDAIHSFEVQPQKKRIGKKQSRVSQSNTSMQVRKKVIFKADSNYKRHKAFEKPNRHPNRSEITIQDVRIRSPSNFS